MTIEPRVGAEGVPDESPHAWRQVLRYALGLLVGGVAIWLVVSAAGGVGDAVAALRDTNAWWLVPAVAAESASYVLSGIRFRVLAGDEAGLSVVEATEITLVAHGLGLLTPAAPAEGMAFQYHELGLRGVPRRRAALTIGFEQWFSTRIFYLVHALNLLLIVATRDFPADAQWPLLAAAAILTLLVLTAMAAARPAVAARVAVGLGALRFWKPRPSVDERRAQGEHLHAAAMQVVGPPRHRVALVLLSAGSLLADALCFWTLLFAVGIHDGFDLALLTVGAGAAAASIPLLPGGIGAVEAAMPALLAWYGSPVAAALSATLLYRAIGTFLPAAAGAVSIPLLRLRRRGRTPAAPQ
jgi:putative heme transporter